MTFRRQSLGIRRGLGKHPPLFAERLHRRLVLLTMAALFVLTSLSCQTTDTGLSALASSPWYWAVGMPVDELLARFPDAEETRASDSIEWYRAEHEATGDTCDRFFHLPVPEKYGLPFTWISFSCKNGTVAAVLANATLVGDDDAAARFEERITRGAQLRGSYAHSDGRGSSVRIAFYAQSSLQGEVSIQVGVDRLAGDPWSVVIFAARPEIRAQMKAKHGEISFPRSEWLHVKGKEDPPKGN